MEDWETKELWWETEKVAVVSYPEARDEDTGLVSLEFNLGDISLTVSGNYEEPFNYWEMDYGEAWIDRRTSMDFEGPLPAVKLQAFYECQEALEFALNNPPTQVLEA